MIERLRDERGVALVMALGILLALTITTISLLQYTGSHGRDVRFYNARQKSLSIAEAGLNEALSVLYNAADPTNAGALPPGSATHEGGSVTWSGSLSGDLWTVTATSTVRNPSGAADLHDTVGSQVRLTVQGEGQSAAWNYVFADSQTACTEVQNNAEISAPLYLRGDLCLKNSASLTAEDITVHGKITLENSASIGKSNDPITSLHVGTGCATSSSGPFTLANCNPTNRVYAGTVDSTLAGVTKPTVDLPLWYVNAKPGPRQNCTSGSFPGGFDNDSTMNKSLSAVKLLDGSAYSCTVMNGSTTVGKLVYTPGNPGTFEIKGTVFFDGDIEVEGQAIYTGRGTIYSSGIITFKNNGLLCGVANCDANAWDGSTNMIVFIAGESSGDGFVADNNSKFQGGIYAVADVEQKNSAVIEGPIIADELKFENYSDALNWPPIPFIVQGAPGAGIGTTVLVPVSGSWGG